MGALTEERAARALAAGADVAVWREGFRELCSRRAGERGRAAARPRQARQRHGPARRARPRGGGRARSSAAPRTPTSSWPGVWTHFATADEPTTAFLAEQLAALRRGGRAGRASRPRRAACTRPTAPRPCASPRSHFDMVRCGVAIYGLDPFGRATRPSRGSSRRMELQLLRRRRQALRGRRERRLRADLAGAEPTPGSECCRSATGTASGAALSNNAEVLVGGRRYPVVGTISMDNLTDRPRARDRGRAGRRGGADRRAGRRARSSPRSGAERLETINYEITCGVSRRVPRVDGVSRRRRSLTALGAAAAVAVGARGARQAPTPGSSAARSATPRSASRSATSTSRSSRARSATPRGRSREAAGGYAFPLSERARDLARGRPATRPGTRT